MQIIRLENNNLSKVINQVINVLNNAGLVIYPSDTVYGALVDAKNLQAVKKLISFKNRPLGKAISVFVSGWQMIEDLVEITDKQKQILKAILPGCFTVVLKSKKKVVSLLESEKGTLGLRYIEYLPVLELMKKYKSPVTATSANLGGKPPHYSIESLLKQLPKSKQQLIDLIVDAGKLPRNKPSTVIDLTGEDLKILRHGDLVFQKVNKFYSSSPSQTKKIAQHILKKLIDEDSKKPIIFILQGDLGVGKTIFVKGLGEFFGIKEIVSPTFVVMYEYDIKKSKIKYQKSKIKKMVHIDLYNVEQSEEFEYLKIDNFLSQENLIAIEWGEKSGEIFEKLKEKSKIVFVEINYLNEKERVIEIKS
ncbi:MAG: L-threonylcarbamoyladenylate synthase [Microgenomates group bacterium]